MWITQTVTKIITIPNSVNNKIVNLIVLVSAVTQIRLKHQRKHTHLLTLYVANSLLVLFHNITLSELSCQTHKAFSSHNFCNPWQLPYQHLHIWLQYLHHKHQNQHHWCSIIILFILIAVKIIVIVSHHTIHYLLLQQKREAESWLKWQAFPIEWLVGKHYVTLLNNLHDTRIKLNCSTKI